MCAMYSPLIKLDSSTLTFNETARENYDNDPLVYRGGIRARFGAEMLDATFDLTKNLASITTPLMIIHGSRDSICHPSGSQQLQQHSGSQDLTLKMCTGAGHELFED